MINLPDPRWVQDKKKSSKHFCDGISLICYEENGRIIMKDLVDRTEHVIKQCLICGYIPNDMP